MKPVLVIHGGAGTICKGECDDQVYRVALAGILKDCRELLKSGASALDVVTTAVKLLEDCPLFNAGHGSVFNRDGEHECDASIAFTSVDGKKGAAGVAGLRTVRNPIEAARKVMEESPVALMIGTAADNFASERGLTKVPNSYFSTERRAEQLRAVKAQMGEEIMTLKGEFVTTDSGEGPNCAGEEETKRGTVGAVALDANGMVAAATSTGGLTNKLAGRVGDSACIGHGTIADAATGIAISCTGTGEAFIRSSAAHSLVSFVRHTRRLVGLHAEGPRAALAEAAVDTIYEQVPEWGGDGGLIALMRTDDGAAVLTCFNTSGMYRGWTSIEDEGEVAIFDAQEGDVMSIDVFKSENDV